LARTIARATVRRTIPRITREVSHGTPRHDDHQLSTAANNAASSHLTGPITAAPGIVMHVGEESDGDFVVREIRESRAG
jgi:hypothetical protein